MNHLSPDLCKFLSSLISGFEGHYYWAKTTGGKWVIICADCEHQQWLRDESTVPAWQAEDVIVKMDEICREVSLLLNWRNIAVNVTFFLVDTKDLSIAYKKIEEYLWGVLK